MLHEESGGRAFHISGDEFVLQHGDIDAADEAMIRATKRLANTKLEFTKPDGGKVALKGIGLSHGSHSSLAEAERFLQQDKAYRESTGLHSARGAKPPGARETSGGEGLQAHGDSRSTHGTEVFGQEVAPPAEPTEAQKKSGDYFKPTITWDGDVPIKLENLAGSTRSGTDTNGQPFSQLQKHPYGYFDAVKGKSSDGEKLDVRLGDNPDASHVYVIDQLDSDGRKFDELQPMVGFDSKEAAKKAYMGNFPKGWKGFGAITELPKAAFRTWLEHGSHDKPIAWQKKGRPKDTRFLGLAHKLHERGEQAGWSQVGGKLVRKTEDRDHPDHNVITGTFPWIPKHEWFQHVQGGNTGLGGNNEGKAIAGETLGAKEQRHVQLISDIIESGKIHLHDLERLTDDELRAHVAALKAVSTDPEGVKEDFKLYGGKMPSAAGESGGRRAGTQGDLFGNRSEIANQLAKAEAEIARRQQAAPAPESSETPDLFNSGSKQADLEDASKALAAQETEVAKARGEDKGLTDVGAKIGGARKDLSSRGPVDGRVYRNVFH